MYGYRALINKLNYEIEKGRDVENELATRVVKAREDGKIIKPDVVQWQEKVENIKTRADELSSGRYSGTCFKVLNFPNPISRIRQGREAANLAKRVVELTDAGREFLASEIADFPAVEYIPFSAMFHEFGSRKEAYDMLWEALTNEDGDPIIGIYGMPGVGKTQIVEQAWKQAKDKKIFHRFARVNVGTRRIDVLRLQDQLAGYLNCDLESRDNEEFRASQLKTSLMNTDKTLVILDDIWDVIPLNKIGIPFGDGSFKGCKILLTSPSQHVCWCNNCKYPIQIKTLTEGEAWEMFQNTVGTSNIQSLPDAALAEKVCKECAAVPLLIFAVGRALKFQSEHLWRDALDQLNKGNIEEIDGLHQFVYYGFKESFVKLTDAQKACILLCSLFPQNAEIENNMLFDLATGSQMLDKGRNIHGLVEILKSSSLLLQGIDNYSVKVHDIIRKVARSIAARDAKYGSFNVISSSRWLDNVNFDSRRLLLLNLKEDIAPFAENLVYPDLHTLWLQCNNRSQKHLGRFLKAFPNINYMFLNDMSLVEHLLPIQTLVNLRVLILGGCTVDETFLNSIPENLETLSIWECNLPTPLYLPDLKNLKKLEISEARTK